MSEICQNYERKKLHILFLYKNAKEYVSCVQIEFTRLKKYEKRSFASCTKNTVVVLFDNYISMTVTQLSLCRNVINNIFICARYYKMF